MSAKNIKRIANKRGVNPLEYAQSIQLRTKKVDISSDPKHPKFVTRVITQPVSSKTLSKLS